MKRNEDGEIRSPREEQDVSFSDLGEARITRSRAIKLAGAALAGSALSLVWAGDADARKKKRRRRRRRRRRKAQVNQPRPVTPVLGAITPLILQITNPNDDKPLTIGDVQVVDGDFLGAGLLGGPVKIAPGDTELVTVNLQTGDSLVDAGSLRLIDGRGMPITVVDEKGVQVGNGDIDIA